MTLGPTNQHYQLCSSIVQGFKAILNNVDCSTVEPSTPWIFKSQQASTDSDLVMEMFNTTSVTDARAKLTLSEETSSANPYGILTLDYNYVLTPNSEKQAPETRPT